MSDSSDNKFDIFNNISDDPRNVSDVCSLISQEISQGKITILLVVESLEDLLTNNDEFKRLRGIEIFSLVLQYLPNNFLSKEELIFTADFFCDRLKDHFICTAAVLKGLISICGMKHLDDKAPAKILNALSQNLTCQALPQDARNLYYCILDTLMHKKTRVLLKSPGDFVYSVISAIESESDPRNLMKLFGMLPYFLEMFPLRHLAEETFSVLECYFPVDFQPKGKGSITREDLANGLEECLISTSEFGPYCIPMVVEKLESQLKVAHIDSLKVLIRGCDIWELENINDNISDIWQALKNLVVRGSDPQVFQLAIKAVVAVIRQYSVPTVNEAQTNAIRRLLNDITASTHGFLSDPEQSIFGTATSLLTSVAQASPSACQHIIYTTVPQLLALLKVGTNKPDEVMKALRPIIKASTKFGIPQMNEERLLTVFSNLFPMLFEQIENPRGRAESYLCLSEMISTLHDEQRLQIYSAVNMTLRKEHNISVRQSCAVLVKALSHLFPEEVKLQLLLQNLDFSQDEVKRSVEVFCWTAQVPSLTTFSVSKIMENIIPGTLHAPIVVACLRALCQNLADDHIVMCIGIECSVPEGLIKSWSCFTKEEQASFDENTLLDVSRTIDAIIRPLPSRDQSKILTDCYDLIFPKLTRDPEQCPIELFLLEGLLGSLRMDVVIPNIHALISALLKCAINGSSDLTQATACRLLATIMNKYKEGCSFEEILVKVKSSVEENMKSGQDLEAGTLLCWITKALCLRAHPVMNNWLDMLIDLLKKERTQMIAAQGFYMIMNDSDFLLNRNCYCDIRILYKQRIFGVVEKLVVIFDNSEGTEKLFVSMSIVYLLQGAPKSLLLYHLKKLIKVLVGSLDSENQIVVLATFEVLKGLLKSQEPILEEYIETFVPRCIRNAYASNMKVRMEALDCIYYYGKYKEINLLPYRNTVLNGLTKGLDDRKRLVRQKAVKARNKWFLLGSLPKES